MACLETGVQWRETADRTGEGDTSISPKTATALMIYSGRGERERRHFEQDYRELLQKTTLLKLTPLRQARHVSNAQSLTACSAPCQRENEWWQKGVCSVFTCVGTYTGNCWSYWNKWQCSTQFTQPYHCQLSRVLQDRITVSFFCSGELPFWEVCSMQFGENKAGKTLCFHSSLAASS